MKLKTQSNKAARRAARSERKLAKAEAKLAKAEGKLAAQKLRTEAARQFAASTGADFDNVNRTAADETIRAQAQLRLAKAEAKLLRREAKVAARRANLEAMKIMMSAAVDEAKRLGAYCEVE